MTEEQDAQDHASDQTGKCLANKAKEKKTRAQKPLTKIVMRRLPPTMTEESFLEQVSPIPEHDYMYFAKPDFSLGPTVFSRAYLNFLNVEDIYLFRDKFDGYIFLDEKGVEYVGIVEYAPFQRVPKKKKKKDPKCGTIESDPVYQEFVESLTREPEVDTQPKLEYSYPVTDANDKKVQSTPLLEYLAARRQDKRGRDERRRRENDKRKMRNERKPKEATIKLEDLSEDENGDDSVTDTSTWFGKEKVYHRSKMKVSNTKSFNNDSKTRVDWDTHFPALSAKTHSTFTISSDKPVDRDYHESQKSCGDSLKEEETGAENEVKKIKPRDWDKEKPSSKSKDEEKVAAKDGTVFESKTFREKKGGVASSDRKKKTENDKNDDASDELDKSKRDKKDKLKESPREQKIKKYSDTRKERLAVKNEKTPTKADVKKSNHDDIKPFTQLPHVKTDDLTKLIEEMDRKGKTGEGEAKKQRTRDKTPDAAEHNDDGDSEDSQYKRQRSFDERSKSPEREGSEENDKSEERRERRIRNKDRPSLVIYQPGMGRISKQRLARDKADT